MDGDEGVVEVGLERAVAVCVDDLQGVGVCDGNMVRRNARESTCYFSIKSSVFAVSESAVAFVDFSAK